MKEISDSGGLEILTFGCRLIAEEPRLMPHLHFSLQAGDDLVLKRMARRHSRKQALAARPLRSSPGLQDTRKDWRRWSVVERCGAMTVLLALIALFVLSVAILVTTYSV
jgi:hypothetical protein